MRIKNVLLQCIVGLLPILFVDCDSQPPRSDVDVCLQVASLVNVREKDSGSSIEPGFWLLADSDRPMIGDDDHGGWETTASELLARAKRLDRHGTIHFEADKKYLFAAVLPRSPSIWYLDARKGSSCKVRLKAPSDEADMLINFEAIGDLTYDRSEYPPIQTVLYVEAEFSPGRYDISFALTPQGSQTDQLRADKTGDRDSWKFLPDSQKIVFYVSDPR